jgi:hypothetical protein
MKLVDKMMRGVHPIGKKNKSSFAKLAEVTPKFSKIVVHHDPRIINAVFPPEVDKTPGPLGVEAEEAIIENLRVICDPDYKLGSNIKAEKFFEIAEHKLGDIKEIQKKYLGELIKLQINKEKMNRRSNNEVIAKQKQEDAKYQALARIEHIRIQLEHKGIKLSI